MDASDSGARRTLLDNLGEAVLKADQGRAAVGEALVERVREGRETLWCRVREDTHGSVLRATLENALVARARQDGNTRDRAGAQSRS